MKSWLPFLALALPAGIISPPTHAASTTGLSVAKAAPTAVRPTGTAPVAATAKLPAKAVKRVALPTPKATPRPSVPGALKPDFKVDPTFTNLKAMTFAGIATYTGIDSPRITELWNKRFADVMTDDRGRGDTDLGLDKSRYAYGLELFPPSFKTKHEFTYMACFAVSDPNRVPLHLVQSSVPAASYAVFKVPDGLKGIGASYQFIYQKWLPTSGYDIAYSFDIERYDTTAEHAGNLSIEILLPVAPRRPRRPR